MNVTLVKLPVLLAFDSLSYHQSVPALGLAYIAAAIREDGHKVNVIDAVGDAVTQYRLYSRNKKLLIHGLDVNEICERISPGTEVVGIGSMFLHETHLLHDVVTSIKAKYPHVKVVIGGENATSFWDVIMHETPGIDVCVLGEGEAKIGLVLEAFDNKINLSNISGIVFREENEVIKTSPGERLKEISNLPKPAWDLFPVEAYLESHLSSGTDRGRSMPMITSRGCPYKCKYCSAPEMWTTRYVTRSPVEVVDEIESNISRYHISNIDFHDLTSFITKKWIKEFCEIIEARQLKFTWQIPGGSRSEVIDEETVDYLYRSGCRNYTFAPESGSARLLKLLKKQLNLPHIIEAMKIAKRGKMVVDANIIIGTPDEIKSDLWATYKMLMQFALAGIDMIAVMMFAPYPGSEYYQVLRKEGKIIIDEHYIYSSLLRVSTGIKSYNPHYSPRFLLTVQYLYLFSFFGLLYLSRPWYFFTSIKNAFSDVQVSKVEKMLVSKYKQRKILKTAVRLSASAVSDS